MTDTETKPAKDDEALVRAVSEELQLAGCPAPDPDAAYAEKQRDFEDFAHVAIAAVRAHDAERAALSAQLAEARQQIAALREALEIARDALRRISDACPATYDMTVAHGMAAVADEALARIEGALK